ncbi:ankyrin [Teratosphaeria nubilosa]|uniref:Ankyrin n=1 Tax=Teratosphaeria nubilosa TaxID=161662 RepID=A0A6G1LPD7_9PEZI|nr:ankyrin [Teratosphaeria nubilosa]
MDHPPGADDMLYSAVQNRDLFDVQQAINDLKEPHRPTLSRAMIASISTSNIPALLLLLSHGELDEEVVEAAAASENIQLVQVILEHGWPINQALRCGSIPSILSLGIRNADFLRSLIALGADPNKDSNLGETALSFAIREGTMKTVKLLLASGADIIRGDLLHCACLREPSEDTHELIAMLIQSGVPVDTYQWDNETARMMRYGYPQRTALHVACKQQNYPAARTLLEFGANPHCLQKKGERYGPPSPYDLTTPGSTMRNLPEDYVRRR